MPTVYSTTLHFSRIEVLESLSDGDLRTGRELFDSVLNPAQAQGGPSTRYHSLETAAELQSILGEIAAATKASESAPIIHLDAHGSEDGLSLTSGELVPWSALSRDLVAINRASRMNLLVVAGTCKGWYLTTGLMPADRAPLFMLIGAPDNITAGYLEAAHKRFYSTLVTALDVNEALAAMNENRDYNDWPIKPASAEILFCRVFRYYLAGLERGTELQERENRLVAEVVRAGQLDLVQSAEVRDQARAHLRDHAWWYEHLRTPFLMLDLFPANQPRFGLTYDKCVRTPA